MSSHTYYDKSLSPDTRRGPAVSDGPCIHPVLSMNPAEEILRSVSASRKRLITVAPHDRLQSGVKVLFSFPAQDMRSVKADTDIT